MTVEVTPLNVLGVSKSGITVTSFSDTFNRPNGTLGTNWIQTISAWTPTINPITTSTFGILNAPIDGAQAMTMTPVGTLNPGMTYMAGIWALPIMTSNFGLSQFCEWKMVAHDANAGNDVLAGPALLMTNRGGQSVGTEQQGLACYRIEVSALAASKGQLALRRGNGVVFTTLVLWGVNNTVVNGDVIRMEAKVNAGNVTLTIKRNGAVLGGITGGTIATNPCVDNTVGQIRLGTQGFFASFAQGNSGGEVQVSQWRNFSGGLL